jgi:DNA-binding transcriptional ArsR family regulator
MDKKTTQQEADIFKVLSVGSRLEIIALLKQRGPMNVGDMATALDVSPSAVSQHLKVLRLAGLVRHERRGYWVSYAVDAEALGQCCQRVIKVCICKCGDEENEVEPMEVKATNDIELLRMCAEDLRRELEEIQKQIEKLEQEKR